MSHVLRRMGEAALQFRRITSHIELSPVISRRRAMVLRKQWLSQGQPWPYEHIVPGILKNDPPYRGGYMKGHKQVKIQEDRRQLIEKSLAKMPQLIAEYRESRRLKVEDITAVDKLLMSQKQIKEKYMKKALK